ncbi:hypothetical protein EC988_000089 [Linderina pennispora]|nr:hypothetical protein EC988_000089 [Linderina pennispora]
MAVKRTYDSFIEGIPFAAVEHTVAKLPRTNSSGDETDRAMMLFRYGQQQQQHQQQRQQQQHEPMSIDMEQCTSCTKLFVASANLQSSGCRRCLRAVCPSCIQPCCCCGGRFCQSCSMSDYTNYDIQTVCLDCN